MDPVQARFPLPIAARDLCPATAISWGFPWQCELVAGHEQDEHEAHDPDASSPSIFCWEDE